MKRTLALIFVFVLLLTNAILPVHAEEADNDLLSKACSVFPEYASKMLGNAPSTSVATYSVNPKAIIVNETRPVKDNEYLTYTEYANGQIILTGVSSDDDFIYNKTTNSYGSGSGGSSFDITITVQYVGEGHNSGAFTLKNIVYTVASGAYDVIHSAGTPSATGYFSYDASNTVVVYNESSSSPAKIRYSLKYQFYDVETMPGAVKTAVLLFQLQNNSVTISVTDTT